jgi:hypothetical protein
MVGPDNLARIDMPVGSSWFGDQRIGGILIERPEYVTLRNDAIQGWQQASRRDTLIIGTPGIGPFMQQPMDFRECESL